MESVHKEKMTENPFSFLFDNPNIRFTDVIELKKENVLFFKKRIRKHSIIMLFMRQLGEV